MAIQDVENVQHAQSLWLKKIRTHSKRKRTQLTIHYLSIHPSIHPSTHNARIKYNNHNSVVHFKRFPTFPSISPESYPLLAQVLSTNRINTPVSMHALLVTTSDFIKNTITTFTTSTAVINTTASEPQECVVAHWGLCFSLPPFSPQPTCCLGSNLEKKE
jgi:hypothetical protein